MKAKITLDLNLSSKSTIGYENFLKKNNFKIFCFDFHRKKKFRTQIFQKEIIQPPKTNFEMILNTQNENYMKV